MMNFLRLLLLAPAILAFTMLSAAQMSSVVTLPTSKRLEEIRARVLPEVKQLLSEKEVALGNPIFIRAFKESRELEVWLQQVKTKKWVQVKTYQIHTWGGGILGPKLAEGDGQAPEGIYSVGVDALNPNSSYHLSFNIGYPNSFDKAKGRTGSLIMIHGAKVSIGCFAMTDPVIEQIYLMAEAALGAGQKKFPVHLFPFRMTDERMTMAASNTNLAFWKNLKPIYDHFVLKREVPSVNADASGYHIAP